MSDEEIVTSWSGGMAVTYLALWPAAGKTKAQVWAEGYEAALRSDPVNPYEEDE